MVSGKNESLTDGLKRIVDSKSAETSEEKIKIIKVGRSSITIEDALLLLRTIGDVFIDAPNGNLYVNGALVGVVGGGGGTPTNKIVGSGCTGSVIQPTVECSPTGAPCEIHVTAGKTGKIVFKRST